MPAVQRPGRQHRAHGIVLRNLHICQGPTASPGQGQKQCWGGGGTDRNIAAVTSALTTSWCVGAAAMFQPTHTGYHIAESSHKKLYRETDFSTALFG